VVKMDGMMMMMVMVVVMLPGPRWCWRLMTA
jgi:hypothetical protein